MGNWDEFEKFTNVPYVQVRADALVHFSMVEPRPERRYKKLEAKTYSGRMTDHAAMRIRKKVDLFLQISPQRQIFNPVTGRMQPFRLGFMTLTISSRDIITSTEAVERVLKPFLRKLRKTPGLSYIWKGELQERGQPHFHLTINQFIHHSDVRNMWNNAQTAAGYTNDYFSRHGHRNPPSTEIKSVYRLARIGAYLAKYLAKDEQSNGWVGKCWGCSDNLKTMRHFYDHPDEITMDKVQAAVDEGSARKVTYEQCTFTLHDRPVKLLSGKLGQAYAEHLGKKVSAKKSPEKT